VSLLLVAADARAVARDNGYNLGVVEFRKSMQRKDRRRGGMRSHGSERSRPCYCADIIIAAIGRG
jgi:hypothetical protein